MRKLNNRGLPFVELAALGRNEPWRYFFSFVFIVATGFGLQTAGYALLVKWGLGDTVRLVLEPDAQAGNASVLDQIIGFAAVMWGFVGFLIGTALAVQLVHRRSWRSLISAGTFNWLGFRAATFFAVALPLSALAVGVALTGERPEISFEPRTFLPFAAAILLLMPFQVLAEEVFFRGYLMQGVAQFSKSYWLRWLLPAALFAALHIFNREVLSGGIWVMSVYMLLALYFGLLALRGNGLEYSFGMHLGNNLYVTLFVAPIDSSLNTPALIRTEEADWGPIVPIAFAVLLAVHYIFTFTWVEMSRNRRRGKS